MASLPGVTPIASADGRFVVWSARLPDLEPGLGDDAAALARRIAAEGADALAVELPPRPGEVPPAAVALLVDELQLRGTGVGLHGALSPFLTTACMDGLHARFAAFDDLAACLSTLRRHDALRRRSVRRGGGVHQLRLPGTASGLAPMCRFVRDRLEEGGVEAPTVLAMLRPTYAALVEILTESAGDTDLAASVTLHDDTASITILDRGRPRGAGVVDPGPEGAVDRIHRFRIPERHNALVLEKRLGGADQSR